MRVYTLSMLHCPRCDKRITPDHRCLSRRFFFGMLAGAAAAVLAPKPVMTEMERRKQIAIAQLKVIGDYSSPRLLRAGDKLSINFSALPSGPLSWSLSLAATGDDAKRGLLRSTTHASVPRPNGTIFIAPREMVVLGARVLIGDTVHRVPIEIKRDRVV